MKPYKIYLAGSMTGHRKEDVNGWRDELCSLLNSQIHAVSPFRDKEYLDDGRKIGHHSNVENHPFDSIRGINARDTFDLKTSDIVVACFLGTTERSLGTAAEIWGAGSVLNKPVIMIADKDNEHVKHPMLNDACAHIVGTVEEAAFIINSFFGVN